MYRSLAGLVALALAAPATAAELTEGHWRLAQMPTAYAELPVLLLKVEKENGMTKAEVADLPAKSTAKLESFKTDGDKIVAVVGMGPNKYAFEATVDAKDPTVARGTFGDDKRIVRAVLVRQEKVKLPTAAEAAAARPKAPEPYQAATKLNNAPAVLQFRARQSKDVNEKAELLAQAKEARKVADEKVPSLWRETAAKHADSPYAVDAAGQILRVAAKVKATPQEVADWVKLIDRDAARYGPRYEREAALQTAVVLNGQKGFAAAALAAASKGAEGLTAKSPLPVQEIALRTLKAAQTAAGKAADANATDARLVKVQAALDEEYLRTVPPFKPAKFAGRKDKGANRVAVMELFTGAQCPPCVAADVAFDALEKAYGPKDLILIQYHMHIPGPDPLVNPDDIARWDYYAEKFAENVRGTPTTLFNGKPFEEYDHEPTHRGGGGMANAENKFNQYTAIINPLLEMKTDVKVGGVAKRSGDVVSVGVAVDGAKGDNVKVRVVLVEESIKYAGGNGLRLHHRVVRAVPDARDGFALKDGSLRKTVPIDLAAVKANLTRHLDEYAADRPFPYPERPMDLAHLKVIALVQDDATGEILNAAEFPVEGK